MMQGPSPEKIKDIFSSVAHGYDKANDAMTFGLARTWRRQLVHWSGVRTGESVLDCATGTGDLAFEFKKAVGRQGTVAGTDFCAEMLDAARAKSAANFMNVDFSEADAHQLPFRDSEFDVASMAYGIRNVENPLQVLREMARVVKPGGRVMILETGDSPALGLRPFLDFYFRKVVPRVGGWLTGQRQAYEYLNESSRAFPSREAFLSLMTATGMFSHTAFQPLMGGASFIYNGKVGPKA
jgi:demethylmenaquinone methyltransferase/2-methoxy-6-polyprenyl-1,4-benzoquinol methylase